MTATRSVYEGVANDLKIWYSTNHVNIEAYNNVVICLCRQFKIDNASFDITKFRKACGL